MEGAQHLLNWGRKQPLVPTELVIHIAVQITVVNLSFRRCLSKSGGGSSVGASRRSRPPSVIPCGAGGTHPAPARAGCTAGELDWALSFVIAAAAITPDRRELLSNVLLVRKYRSARRQAHGRESAGAASAPRPAQSWAPSARPFPQQAPCCRPHGALLLSWVRIGVGKGCVCPCVCVCVSVHACVRTPWAERQGCSQGCCPWQREFCRHCVFC